jgi:hypothetical protein
MRTISLDLRERVLAAYDQEEGTREALLRTAQARTRAALITVIGSALQRVTRQDAVDLFASCAYSFI